MDTPSVSTLSMNSSIPREPPGVVTFRYQHDMGKEMAYVRLAATHEEAQEIAARAFPSWLGAVDPSWIFFTLAVRYRSTGERKEIGIAPTAWSYVTSKLVPYRMIDVHVVPPSSPSSSTSKGYAQLYPVTPPTQHVPPYPESPRPNDRVPLYPDSPRLSDHAPPYQDPPPKYPGSPKARQKKDLHPHFSTGYGYGFAWQDQVGDSSQDQEDYEEPYHDPRRDETSRYDEDLSDRRSMGWSESSMRVSSPGRPNIGLLSSIRERFFPISWETTQARSPRKRRRDHKHMKRIPDYEYESKYSSPNISGSGRSYVPSLI